MFQKAHQQSGKRLTVYIDGAPVEAEANEYVAAVILRQAEVWSRTTPVSGAKRAPYCMMGVCFECLATVDGVPSVQTCLAPVREGMRIERQRGRWDATS
jgi:hypothetical protein